MKRLGVVLLFVTLAACGQGPRAMSNDTSKALQAEVAHIRTSASAHDTTALAAELAALRAHVAQLREVGQLSETAAQAILDAATRVDQNVAVITTTTTVKTVAPNGGRGSDDGENKDKGEGHGD